VGEVSLIATDLLDFLPAAIRQLQAQEIGPHPEESASPKR
jgi:hypothetical protein